MVAEREGPVPPIASRKRPAHSRQKKGVIMSRTESYKDRTFIVDDPDARIRNPDNQMEPVKFAAGDQLPPGAQVGDFKRIPKGTEVKVDQVRRADTGVKGGLIFAHALTTSGTELGWTSTRNFRGK